MNNAAKYSDDGGHIRISAAREGAEVIIRVSDTGVGITREMLSKVFELFAQVESSIDRSHGGLGIGLTLVRALTEMHGGRVSADSEGPGKGSEFTVRLPLHTEEQAARTGPSVPLEEAATAKTSSCFVLLVDDNADTLQSMAQLLGLVWPQGHHGPRRPLGRPTAQETSARGDPSRPRASRYDGYEVAETLRQGGMTEAVLVAVSGYAAEKDRQRSPARRGSTTTSGSPSNSTHCWPSSNGPSEGRLNNLQSRRGRIDHACAGPFLR